MTRYQLRRAPTYAGPTDRRFIGIVRESQTNKNNGREMVSLRFEDTGHQMLWGTAWFYWDDLEEVGGNG